MTATTSLLLTKGLRRLRTADIASVAETTESTMFRHFPGGLDSILAQTYDYCWSIINAHVGSAGFEHPNCGSPNDQVLADTGALWTMRESRELSEAATVAFLFLRRRTDIFGTSDYLAENQARFERRWSAMCDALARRDGSSSQQFNGFDSAEGHAGASATMRQLLLNYCATIWLTWYCMPVGSDDLTIEHDLTPSEAQLGVLVLLDRAKSDGFPDARTKNSLDEPL